MIQGEWKMMEARIKEVMRKMEEEKGRGEGNKREGRRG